MTLTLANNRCSVCGRVNCCCYYARTTTNGDGALSKRPQKCGMAGITPLAVGGYQRKTIEEIACYGGHNAGMISSESVDTSRYGIHTCRITEKVTYKSVTIASGLTLHYSCKHALTMSSDPALEYAGPMVIPSGTAEAVITNSVYDDKVLSVGGSPFTTTDALCHTKAPPWRGKRYYSIRLVSTGLMLLVFLALSIGTAGAGFRCDLWAADIASSPGFLCLCPQATVDPNQPACVTSLPNLPSRECHGSMVDTCVEGPIDNCRTELFKQGRLGGCFGGICMLTDNCV